MDSNLDESRIQAELRQFKDVERVHDLPPIQSYWSQTFLAEKFRAIGFKGMWDYYVQSVLEVRSRESAPKTLRIVSIGSGNCDIEITLAERLLQAGESDFFVECLDINAKMLERGAAAAEAKGITRHLRFVVADLSEWSAERDSVDVFFANQSLHHIVALEKLFETIQHSMTPAGCLLTGDMIGRNGHMLWPEAHAVVRALWNSIEQPKKLNHRSMKFDTEYPNKDFSDVGFEGIRAQDILPLLVEHFHQDVFLGFTNITRPFVSRAYGPNYDPANQQDKQFIKFVATLDDSLIDEGYLKPTQCFATFRKQASAQPRQYRHWSAAYSVRKVT